MLDGADPMGIEAGVFGCIEQVIDDSRPVVGPVMTAQFMPQMFQRIELRRVRCQTDACDSGRADKAP